MDLMKDKKKIPILSFAISKSFGFLTNSLLSAEVVKVLR